MPKQFFTKLKTIKIISVLLNTVALLFACARNVFAQSMSCSGFLCDPHNTYCGILCQIVPQLPNFIIGGGVVAAIVFICINGVNYMSAGDDVKKMTNARMGLTWAAVGLGAIILSFAVIRAAALLLNANPNELFIIKNVGNCEC